MARNKKRSSIAGEELTVGPGGAMEEIDLVDDEPVNDEGLPAGESFPDEAAYANFYAGRPLDDNVAAPAAVPLAVVSGETTVKAHHAKKGAGKKGGRHAKHASTMSGSAAKDKPELPEYMRKSRRMRHILIVVIVLLVVILGALAYFGINLYKEATSSAVQQALTTEQETEAIAADDASDSAVSAKVTTVPDLVALIGHTQEEAVELLQHGAQAAEPRAVNEEGNPIKSEVRVALTAEPADSRTGTPTVYLGLDADGKIIQAGYSTSTSSLGYGSLSFKDAVVKEHIIEQTLAEAGVPVTDGAVELPEDSAEYTSLDTDGKTTTKEYCSFTGQVEIDERPYTWSSVLSYDYSMANASDNLADTVRTIFVYVNA